VANVSRFTDVHDYVCAVQADAAIRIATQPNPGPKRKSAVRSQFVTLFFVIEEGAAVLNGFM
jgi:hypothetical protein